MTADPTDRPTGDAPIAVVEAMRALLWVKTAADARAAAEHLVRGLGGVVLPAGAHDAGELPADLSFGDGDPLVASAPVGSEARALFSTSTWFPSFLTPEGRSN